MIFAIFWRFYCKMYLVLTAISIIANAIQFLMHYSALYSSYLHQNKVAATYLFQIFPCWNECKIIKRFQPAYPEMNFLFQIILINLRLMKSCTFKLLSSIIVHSCSAHLPTPMWTLCSEGCRTCGLWRAPYCQLPVVEWPLQKNWWWMRALLLKMSLFVKLLGLKRWQSCISVIGTVHFFSCLEFLSTLNLDF